MKSKTKRSSKGKVSVPLYRWMMFWLLVLCNVALIAALFGRVDVRTLLPKTEVKVVERVVEIEKDSPSSEEESTADNFPYECYVADPGPAETHLTYVDKRTSVSMELPYSFSWGMSCPPAQQVIYPEGPQEALYFGPSVRIEGEGVGRDSVFFILAATGTSAVRAQIEEELSQARHGGAQDISAIRQRNVNGLTVFSYSYYWLGLTNTWTAVGRNYVYVIASNGWLTDAEAIKIIQSLRVTR